MINSANNLARRALIKPSTMTVRLIRNLSHLLILNRLSERFFSNISDRTTSRSGLLYHILDSKGLKAWLLSMNATLLLMWSILCFCTKVPCFLTSSSFNPNSLNDDKSKPFTSFSVLLLYGIALTWCFYFWIEDFSNLDF